MNIQDRYDQAENDGNLEEMGQIIHEAAIANFPLLGISELADLGRRDFCPLLVSMSVEAIDYIYNIQEFDYEVLFRTRNDIDEFFVRFPHHGRFQIDFFKFILENTEGEGAETLNYKYWVDRIVNRLEGLALDEIDPVLLVNLIFPLDSYHQMKVITANPNTIYTDALMEVFQGEVQYSQEDVEEDLENLAAIRSPDMMDRLRRSIPIN